MTHRSYLITHKKKHILTDGQANHKLVAADGKEHGPEAGDFLLDADGDAVKHRVSREGDNEDESLHEADSGRPLLLSSLTGQGAAVHQMVRAAVLLLKRSKVSRRSGHSYTSLH